ncbi:MAG: class II fructose-bisphosphate aldolase, partial [Kiritimatiellae bacterium]|nr:class II fructose-bisphosphate aldolase [Kiritimatiellia bacterium]
MPIETASASTPVAFANETASSTSVRAVSSPWATWPISRSPYDENVKWTKHVADYAHALGATCEGEIGHVAQGDETALTDVEEA